MGKYYLVVVLNFVAVANLKFPNTVVLADKVQSENPISLLKLVELDQFFVYNRNLHIS